jgi:hypothetical protein
MNYPLNKVITIDTSIRVNGVSVYTKGRFIRKWCIVSPERFIVRHYDSEELCKSDLQGFTNHIAEIKTIGL